MSLGVFFHVIWRKGEREENEQVDLGGEKQLHVCLWAKSEDKSWKQDDKVDVDDDGKGKVSKTQAHFPFGELRATLLLLQAPAPTPCDQGRTEMKGNSYSRHVAVWKSKSM